MTEEWAKVSFRERSVVTAKAHSSGQANCLRTSGASCPARPGGRPACCRGSAPQILRPRSHRADVQPFVASRRIGSSSPTAVDSTVLVFGLRLRQTEGFVISMLKLIGLDLAVPDHTTLSHRAIKPRAPNKRHDDRIPQKGPVHVLIDSTRLQVHGAGQWLEENHGVKSRRGWRKLHLMLDADTGDIIAHVMTEQRAGNASQVERCSTRLTYRLVSSPQMAPMMAIRPMTPLPITVLTKR
ncbi:DDE family transposase [Rhizobium sp. BK376]|nr:DDE family transposase [Rhizobium sp. BK376]